MLLRTNRLQYSLNTILYALGNRKIPATSFIAVIWNRTCNVCEVAHIYTSWGVTLESLGGCEEVPGSCY
jgi:hypothetical protein